MLYCLIAFYIKAGTEANFWITFCITTATALYMFVALSLLEEKAPDRQASILGIPTINSVLIHLYIQIFISIGFHVLSEFFKEMSMFPPVALGIITVAGLTFVDFYSDEHTSIGIVEESDVPDDRYFATCLLYIEHVSESAGYAALTEAMERLKSLVKRIDISMSDVKSMQAISLEISTKCIAVEDAVNRKDASKVLTISREILSLCEKIERRASVAIICFKEESFYRTDNDVAMAQIDLILDELELDDEEDIVKAPFDLKEDMRFKKALIFADEEYKELLNGYADEVNEKLKDSKKKNVDKKKLLEKRSAILAYTGLPTVLVCVVAIFCLWYFALQPAGISYVVNEDGKTVTVVDYNTFCGDEVVIPEKINGKRVTVIGERAFQDCDSLKSVSIPEGVTLVKHSSFKNCTSLTVVYMPKSLSEIQAYAFKECKSLANVYYEGTEEEWKEIKIIQYGNDSVSHKNKADKANINYGYNYGG